MATATTPASLLKLAARFGGDQAREEGRLAAERKELELRACDETIEASRELADLERRRALVAEEARLDRENALLLRICQPWAAAIKAPNGTSPGGSNGRGF
jgi:hypothetical protein